jgi:hypothetical protein
MEAINQNGPKETTPWNLQPCGKKGLDPIEKLSLPGQTCILFSHNLF